jgi:hypothetical protein
VRAQRHRPGAEVGAEPARAGDDRVVFERRSAHVVEQRARCSPAGAGGVAQRGGGQRRDGGKAQHTVGVRGRRAPVVEQHDGTELVAARVHRRLREVARRQRAGLPGELGRDEAPHRRQAPLGRGPGGRRTDGGQDYRHRTAGGFGGERGQGVEAVTGQDGVDHPHVQVGRGGAHGFTVAADPLAEVKIALSSSAGVWRRRVARR